MGLPAGEVPHEPRVDRPEGQPAGARTLARTRHVVEDPGYFAAREVRVDHEPGATRDERLFAPGFERIAELGGAAVLPHDRVVDRLAGFAVPHDRGFALVGDPDGR